jgi:hypothetical protein
MSEQSPIFAIHVLTPGDQNKKMELVYKHAKSLELRDSLNFVFLTEKQN